MNAFQRPALEGDSIKNGCCSEDINVAIETISGVIDILKPDLVIIASVYAWQTLATGLQKHISPDLFHYTCHAASPWHWNRNNYQNGRRKMMRILKEAWQINHVVEPAL